VAETALTGKLWNVAPTFFTFTVTSAQQAYVLEDGSLPEDQKVRKIIEVERTDVARPYTHTLIPFSERNRGVTDPHYPTLSSGTRSALSAYRRSDGRWVVAFVDKQPDPQTIRVWYEPCRRKLVDAAEEPMQVPRSWHKLIPVAAAVLGKITTNRDPSGLLIIRERWLHQMRMDLDDLTSATRSRAI
jgi:hypothetical protein